MLSVNSRVEAQRGRAKPPSPGDIIKYEDFHDGETYGLVIEVQRMTMDVEKVDRRGEIESQKVQLMATAWVLVDSFKNKKSAAKMRSWKSSDGKFEIEATLVGIEGDKVRLKKANGKTISVPLRKLSDKDRKVAEKGASDEENEDPFAVEESEDVPEDLRILMERREVLMEDQALHLKFAKQNPNLMIGDIIKYEKFPRGVAYGIVTSLDFSGGVETVGDDGDLEEDNSFGRNRRWWFVDRDVPPLKIRTWNSSSGTFKIKARLVGVEDGDKLLLEKEDGESLTVPLSKLGDSDEKYVSRNRSRFSGSQNDGLEELRSNYGDDMQQLLVRRADLMKRVAASSVAARDVAKMKSISLNTQRLEIPAEQLQPMSLDGQPFSLSFTVPAGMHARIERVCHSPESGDVAMIVSSPFSNNPTLVVANIESDQVVTNIDSEDVGDDGEVLAMSPSGRRLLVYSEDTSSVQQLELWGHEDGTLKRISVVPYDSFRTPRAHLFSDANGVILDDKGSLVFFDLEDRIKPTHAVAASSIHGGGKFQISQDQNRIFYFTSGNASVHVIDVESKKCIGGVRLGNDSLLANAQVDPDGKTATRIESKTLSIFDLQTGDAITQLELPASMPSMPGGDDSFPYMGSNLIKTFHGGIYDLELGMEIGSIERGGFGSENYSNSTRITAKVDRSGGSSGRGGFGGMMVGSGGGRARGDRKSKTPAVVNVDYQKLDVDEIVSFAQGLTKDDIIEFGSGDSVQLIFDVDDANVEQRLRDQIGDLMDDNGITIDRDGDFVLELKYSEGKPQTQKYNILGYATPRTRDVTITPKSASAKLSYRGEKIWSQAVSANLGGVWSEDALNEIIQKAKSLSARKLLEFKYPAELKTLKPSLKRKFSWR